MIFLVELKGWLLFGDVSCLEKKIFVLTLENQNILVITMKFSNKNILKVLTKKYPINNWYPLNNSIFKPIEAIYTVVKFKTISLFIIIGKPDNLSKKDYSIPNGIKNNNGNYLTIKNYKEVSVSFKDDKGNPIDPVQHIYLNKCNWAKYCDIRPSIVNIDILCDIIRYLIRFHKLLVFK